MAFFVFDGETTSGIRLTTRWHLGRQCTPKLFNDFEGDMVSEWYFIKDQKKHGPFSSEGLRDLARSGQLLPTDKVWREGMSEPAIARMVPGLFAEQAPVTSVPQPQSLSNRFKDPSKLPSDVWALVKLVLHHPIAVGISMLCCFPIGLILLWQSEAIGTRWKWLIFGGFVSLLAFGQFISNIETRAMNDRLAKANAQWESGETVDAIEQFRSILDSHWYRLDKADRSTLIRRVVEFDLVHGNQPNARKLIERVVRGRVSVTFESELATSMLDEQRRAFRMARASNDSTPNEPNSPAEKLAGSDSDLVDAVELIQAFDNEAAGSEVFTGKTIRVEGRVVKVTQGYASEGPFASKQNYAVIGGKLGPNGYKTWVECYFSSGKDATSIQPGGHVVIKGKVQGRLSAAVRMTECVVEQQ